MWQKICALYNPNEKEKELAQTLFWEWQEFGYIERTQTSLLQVTNAVIAYFYTLLCTHVETTSPVSDHADSSWMTQTDFCFVNIRATGIKENSPGTFIQATKILPAIRTGSIHLAPFTSYQFEVIYAIESIVSIASNLIDQFLVSNGISAEDQLTAFISACHVLNKTVGFDLEPHVVQFAKAVLEKPECFRWIALDEDKNYLINNYSSNDIYTTKVQKKIIADCYALRDSIYAQFGISTFEFTANEQEDIIDKKKSAYFECIRLFIQKGLWPVLSHTWNGVGLPEYVSYNYELNYPEFLYLGETGENHSHFSMGVLTPFAFYDNIPTNQVPEVQNPPMLRKEALHYYCDIFTYWRDNFHFDFIRHDSVDHIFDSVCDDKGTIPMSDRPTPYILKHVISSSKKGGHNYIGNLAERMGTEIQEYASLGYDVILGNDMLFRIDKPHLDQFFSNTKKLEQINLFRQTPCSIAFAIDTHDTGDPKLWGSPLLDAMGFERMRLRHFISRFASCGKTRRPKYEVMGFQDGSSGLYEANVANKNVVWRDNSQYSKSYSNIENLYQQYQRFFMSAELAMYYVTNGYAYWIFTNPNFEYIMGCCASLETAEGNDQFSITIDIHPFIKGRIRIQCYDFNSDVPKFWESDGIFLYQKLEYLGFRMFQVDSVDSEIYV